MKTKSMMRGGGTHHFASTVPWRPAGVGGRLLAAVLLAALAPPAPSADPPGPAPLRPRTLAAALEQMQTLARADGTDHGGVAPISARLADLGGASIEAYDAVVASLVRQRWLLLIENSQIMVPPEKVAVEFDLHPDGSVAGIRATDGQGPKLFGLLCQRAVLDPAPYPAWSSAVSREFGEGPRHATLVFAPGDGRVAPLVVQRRQDRLFAELRYRPRPALRLEPPGDPGYTGYAGGVPWGPAWPWPCGSDLYREPDFRRSNKEWRRQWEREICPKWDLPSCPIPMSPKAGAHIASGFGAPQSQN